MQEWLFKLSKNRWARLVSRKLREAYHFDQFWLSPALEIQKNITAVEPIADGKGSFIYPSFRLDGVGIQVLIRIASMALAHQKGTRYIHIPFVRLEHREIDPVGQKMSDLEWASTWENYFNFGKGNIPLKAAVSAWGPAHLATIFTQEKYRFGDPKREHSVQQGIKKLDERLCKHSVYNLGLCKHFADNKLVLPESLLADLRDGLATNAPGGQALPYHSRGKHVAIHIRRGDVWDQIQKGSTASRFTNKLVGEAYYIDLLRKWSADYHKHSAEPLHFHIFSDGVPENFPGFHFIDEGLAEIPADSESKTVENIHMYLRASTPYTMHALIHAPVLMPGKSSFGAVAAILGKGKLIQDEEIFEFYPYNMLLTNPSVQKRLLRPGQLVPELIENGRDSEN